jgi:hypothetical protein
MHEQKLADRGEPNPRLVAPGLPFKGLCILEKLENVIIHVSTVERPVPPKDRFKSARRCGSIENPTMGRGRNGHEVVSARPEVLAECN